MSESHKIKWLSHKEAQIEVSQTCLLSVAPKENRPDSTVKTLAQNRRFFPRFSQKTDTMMINAARTRQWLTKAERPARSIAQSLLQLESIARKSGEFSEHFAIVRRISW
jgi:hypothetical protein